MGENIQRSETLTTEQVLRTALDMIDADGVDALSMRKLGHAVGRDPMRLYSFAENKVALLDAIAELVLQKFMVPFAPEGNWEGALRSTAHSFRRLVLSHPHMVPLLVTRPMSRRLGFLPVVSLRWLEGLLQLLTDAGFGDVGAVHAYRFFTGFLAGHALHETAELSNDPAEPDIVLRVRRDPLLHRQFPQLQALSSALHRYDGAVELELGLDVVLTGLRDQLHQHLLA